VILSVVYMLWLYQRTFLGKTTSETVTLRDLGGREWIAIAPLVVMMVWLGTYTQSFMPPVTAATHRLLEQSKMNLEIHVLNTAPRTGMHAQVIPAVAEAGQ
jgi:NADH-quinone oxidoreductase subunit M